MSYTYDKSTGNIVRQDATIAITIDQNENGRLCKLLSTGIEFDYNETTKTVRFPTKRVSFPVLDSPDIEGQLVTQLGWTLQKATAFVKLIRKIATQELSRR